MLLLNHMKYTTQCVLDILCSEVFETVGACVCMCTLYVQYVGVRVCVCARCPKQSDAPAGSAPLALCPAALSVSASSGDWQASLVWLHKGPASFEVLKTSIYASPWTKKHQAHLSPVATQADIVATLL